MTELCRSGAKNLYKWFVIIFPQVDFVAELQKLSEKGVQMLVARA